MTKEWLPKRNERVRSKSDGILGTVEDVDFCAVKVLFDDGLHGIYRLDSLATDIEPVGKK